MAEQQQEEFSYAVTPASTVNLNINLSKLPSCGKDNCNGEMLPLQTTTNPKTGTNTVIIYGWICAKCGNNFMLNVGKIITQSVFQDINAQL
jgi:hypothetical protein